MTEQPGGPPTFRQGPPRVGGRGGSPSVDAADEQHALPVDLVRWRRLAEYVLAAEGVRGDVEVSLLFVDEDTIAELNARFMDTEGPTDVLSFPIDEEARVPGRYPEGGSAGPDRDDPDAEDEPLLLGDVLICPAVAARTAPAHAGSLDDELALLTVHGLLHLLGMDHVEDAERAVMQARERDLLDRFHGPLASDPWAS